MTAGQHAPSNGPANRLWTIGRGQCPDCRRDLVGGACPECGADYGRWV